MCCREVLEKRVVEKLRRVLYRSVVGKCCTEVLFRSVVVGKCCREALFRSVGEDFWRRGL